MWSMVKDAGIFSVKVLGVVGGAYAASKLGKVAYRGIKSLFADEKPGEAANEAGAE